ncbi:MAG: S-layer protein [Candidatus Diapherotrites archaeon]
MKGFNVKKLAAIGVGAALLASAVAPIVSASNVQKDDIYNSNGSPNVNIVIGSQAALSDAVWAGNLAAKIAEKAASTGRVSVSATGEDGGSVSELDLSDLTIDVTVGGTVTFGAGSKEYKVNMSSASGQLEVRNANDTNVMTDAQLPHLYNASLAQKVDANNTTPTVSEKIGIDVDVKFDNSSDTKDLVGYIEGGGFYYEVVLGSAGIDLGSTSFTDGTDDNVKIVFFGETYELSTATLSGSPSLRLVKSSAKETYNEGETVEGLVGSGAFDGQDVSVKIVQIIQTGSAVTAYSATFELYDSEGNLIDTQTVASSGTPNLKESFQDDNGDYALHSNLFVNTVAVGATTGIGYVEVTKGTDTIELYDTKGYPYDPTDTTGIYDYSVALTVSGNSLDKIKVVNSREKWNNSSASNGALTPTTAGQSLTGAESNTAVFGQALEEGILGKGFAKVEFLGFETKEELTTLEFGRGVTGLDTSAKGGVSFRGADDAAHSLPFALELDDAESGATFLFDSKTIWYDVNYGTSSTTAGDLNFYVATGDYVNGRTWTIAETGQAAEDDANVSITVQGIGAIVNNTATGLDTNLSIGNSFAVDGVTYTIRDNNVITGTQDVSIGVDGEIVFRKTNSTGTQLFNIGGDSTDQTYGKMYITEDKIFDGNAVTANGVPVNVGLVGNSDRKFYYAVNPAKTLNRLWLMLDADILGSDESGLIQNSKEIIFLGTNNPEVASTYVEEKGIGLDFIRGGDAAIDESAGGVSYRKRTSNSLWTGHYVPQDSDFNSIANYADSTAYFVAEFLVNDNVSTGDFNVYIDTKDGGGLGSFTNSNLSGYSTSMDFNGTTSWNLQEGTSSSYLPAAYTDAGTKATLVGSDGVKIVSPENIQKVQIVVYGTEEQRDVSGGDPLTGLKVGVAGTTDSGTKVTVTAVNGGSCGVASGDGSVVCSAKPETYAMPAAVRNPLVYLDTEAPAGSNIIIGGHLVNALASSLADRLTAPGQMVAEVDASSGDIYAAGYTAGDTGRAVQELINDIDAMKLA